MRQIKFTVASELLRELGERLVGRQYIALAELVKNSFDADASRVDITIGDDSIEVSDNGHGMTVTDFTDKWMRVGSTHKVRERTSPEFCRPLTGSKGIGRLAVQFLARQVEVTSVPNATRLSTGSQPKELFAMVDWESAVQAGDLTEATALYDVTDLRDSIFPLGRAYGTKVVLKKLKHEWNPKEFEDLAREVWFLQAPFRSLKASATAEAGTFQVHLSAPDPEAISLFNTQMSRVLDIYTSRLVGRLLPEGKSGRREVDFRLELEDQSPTRYSYQLPVRDGQYCLIDSLDFEIRIFTLQNRQPYGIPVGMARDYLAKWGGVHIYDAGFRIPYAGPAADWLNLEIDHSHRLTQSQLLPENLNVRMGLNFLPTNSRVLGVVNIDTSREARTAGRRHVPATQHLQIQVSRDRLVANEAFNQLRDAVRFALDYYATRMAVLRLEQKAAKRSIATPRSLIEDVWEVLEEHQEEIPKPVAAQLRIALERTMDSVREQSEWTRNQSGLLGAMATAGAAAIAFDHQFHQQLTILEHHVDTLANAVKANPDLNESIGVIRSQIQGWIHDARDTRKIFSPISDARYRTAVARFKAKQVVQHLSGNLRSVLRGVNIDTRDIDETLLLPEASYPVWMAVFNNVFMNASNAMLDTETKKIAVSSFEAGKRRAIRVQDTGVGIDLDKAGTFFKPLERGLHISPDRRELGLGGSGIGLAIVKMLATDLRAEVRFVRPTGGFSTCFELAWSEDE